MWSQINLLFMIALAFASWILLCYFQYVDQKRNDKDFALGNSSAKLMNSSTPKIEDFCKGLKHEGIGRVMISRTSSLSASSLRVKYMIRSTSSNEPNNNRDIKRREFKDVNPFMCYACIYIILLLCCDVCEQLSKGDVEVLKPISLTEPLDTDDPVLLAIQRRHTEILAARISYLKQENVRLEQELQEIAELNVMIRKRLENFDLKKLKLEPVVLEYERNELNLVQKQEIKEQTTKFQKIEVPNIIHEETEVLDTSITFKEIPPKSVGVVTIADDSDSDNNFDEIPVIFTTPETASSTNFDKLYNIPVSEIKIDPNDNKLDEKIEDNCSNINCRKKRPNNCDETKADDQNINFETPTIFLSREEYYWTREYVINGNHYADSNTFSDTYCSTHENGNANFTRPMPNSNRNHTSAAEDTGPAVCEGPPENVSTTQSDAQVENYRSVDQASESIESSIAVVNEYVNADSCSERQQTPTQICSEVVSSSDDDETSNTFPRNFTTYTETQIYTKTKIMVPIHKQATVDGKTEWQWVDPDSTESIIKLAKQLQGMAE